MQKNCRVVFLFCITTITCISSELFSRNIHRTIDPLTPALSTRWANDKDIHTLRNDHLDPYPFFQLFDEPFFRKHLLPDGKLSFRYEPKNSVEAALLKNHIEILCQEVKEKKKKYTHFTVLQSKDFNRRKGHGLLILKHEEYPFVVKLFIERPDTLINPYHKGLEPVFFFYMGGGINRHLSGFTRLKNLERIREKIAKDTRWSTRIDTPRKWYWLPQSAPWIEITGTNMGPEHKKYHTKIPGTYCIIADAIQGERSLSLFDNDEDKKTILDLCNYLDLSIDPHLNNYMIERDTHKIVLVDTEHFASFVGLKDPVHFESYVEWYFRLAGKFLQNTFGQTKRERRSRPHPHKSMVLT